jgi:hypothetical protein
VRFVHGRGGEGGRGGGFGCKFQCIPPVEISPFLPLLDLLVDEILEETAVNIKLDENKNKLLTGKTPPPPPLIRLLSNATSSKIRWQCEWSSPILEKNCNYKTNRYCIVSKVRGMGEI